MNPCKSISIHRHCGNVALSFEGNGSTVYIDQSQAAWLAERLITAVQDIEARDFSRSRFPVSVWPVPKEDTPEPVQEPWKVAAVSSNHGPFGHKSVIFCKSTGEAVKVLVQAYGTEPVPSEGSYHTTLPRSECPPKVLPRPPISLLCAEFHPCSPAEFLNICNSNAVDPGVARENATVANALARNASANDLRRLFRENF